MAPRRQIQSAILFLAAVAAAPVVCRAQTDAAGGRDVQSQQSVLQEGASTLQQREEAARRLAQRNAPDANRALLTVLQDFSNRDGQIAVGRALAGQSPPDPMFYDVLSSLLGQDRTLTESASQALAAYKNARARETLKRFAANLAQPRDSRTAVVRAMGRLLDKETAATLVDLLRQDDSPIIRDAAADALIEMTGLSQFGHDAQRWSQWWETTRARPESEWTADLLNRSVDRFAETDRRLSRLRERTAALVRDEYRAKTDADKAALLVKLLQDGSEDLRIVGVQLVYDEVSVGKPMPAGIFQALRALVGDSVIDVRQQAVKTLMAANDPGAVDALLAQLAQEKDPDVTGAILVAFGPSHDLRTVDPLLSRLGDDSFTIARSAAEGLKGLAPELAKRANTELAAKVAAALRARLPDTADNVAASQLRTSIVQAMAALGQPGQLRDFYDLIKPSEKLAMVRRAALGGLRRIGSPDSANFILQSLSDPDPGVRLDAVSALESTASFEHADALGRLLVESIERDKDVRARAWEVLQKLLEKGAVESLAVWARKPVIENAPERKLAVLSIIEKKLEAGKRPEQLALYRQNIGEVLLALKRPHEAAEKFKLALDYWKTSGASPAVREPSTLLLLEAMLKDKSFADAATFAAEVIADSQGTSTQPIWSKVLSELERLRTLRDWDTALSLVQAMRKAPFGDLYLRRLDQWEKDIQLARNTGGRNWISREGEPADSLWACL
ncbi:MAG: HEAT repeat domain-containing protein [Tepidisphaerales bacterium]